MALAPELQQLHDLAITLERHRTALSRYAMTEVGYEYEGVGGSMPLPDARQFIACAEAWAPPGPNRPWEMRLSFFGRPYHNLDWHMRLGSVSISQNQRGLHIGNVLTYGRPPAVPENEQRHTFPVAAELATLVSADLGASASQWVDEQAARDAATRDSLAAAARTRYPGVHCRDYASTAVTPSAELVDGIANLVLVPGVVSVFTRPMPGDEDMLGLECLKYAMPKPLAK